MSRNGRTIGLLSAVVFAMIGLSFAAVPLYRLFCAATGFNGTTQRAAEASTRQVDRTVEVRFNANTAPELPWRFEPEQRKVEIKIGETKLVAYRAENLTGSPVAGSATYNVTPEKVGRYFVKVQCFCFEEQTLQPRQVVDMPIYFYVDPEFASDPEMADVKSITLSYTFFRARPGAMPPNPNGNAGNAPIRSSELITRAAPPQAAAVAAEPGVVK